MCSQSPVTIDLDYRELHIDPGEVEYLMGYTTKGTCPEPLLSHISRAFEWAEAHCNIKAGYLIDDNLNVNQDHHTLQSFGITFHTGRIVTGQLQHAEKGAWFLCTAGHALPDRTRRLMEQGELLEGYINDLTGNVVVEAATDHVISLLEKMVAKQNLKITNHYSPGYCEWDITEQKKLFSLLPNNYLGITLSDNALMEPVKSVSGLIGIGENVSFNQTTCNFCTQRNCIYRNRKAGRELNR